MDEIKDSKAISKFIYVYDEESRTALEKLGFKLLNTMNNSQGYIFLNEHQSIGTFSSGGVDIDFCNQHIGKGRFVLSDTMCF